MSKKTFGYPKSDTLDYFRKLQLSEYHRKYGWNLFANYTDEKSVRQDSLLEIKENTIRNNTFVYTINDIELKHRLISIFKIKMMTPKNQISRNQRQLEIDKNQSNSNKEGDSKQ